MRGLLASILLFTSQVLVAEQAQELVPLLEPPELPMPVQSGENLEPDSDINIIRKGNETIQEFRKNGEIYMIKIVPVAGPAYYLIDTNGDGNMDVRKSDLDAGTNINQWRLFQWD